MSLWSNLLSLRRCFGWLALSVAGCARAGADIASVAEHELGRRLAPVTPHDRREYLRRARIFEPVDVSTRNLLEGPPGTPAFQFEQHVRCEYVEPGPGHAPPSGTTPKFYCRPSADPSLEVKVKYGRRNREVYGEMLGSRLCWALGVAADRDYAVNLRCLGCPAHPWQAFHHELRDRPATATRDIELAVLLLLYPGIPIEECIRLGSRGDCAERKHDQGWSFEELDLVDASVGGAPPAEVDALRLLAAFMAYADQKPQNQRLVCPLSSIDPVGHCRAPRLLLADLGATFGRGGTEPFHFIDSAASPTFADWSLLPMWDDPASCRTHLSAWAGPSHPTVREPGRALLAARLAQLSDRQIRDLFTVARVEQLGETLTEPNGHERPVTVDDWAEAFRVRRSEIVEHRCPP